MCYPSTEATEYTQHPETVNLVGEELPYVFGLLARSLTRPMSNSALKRHSNAWRDWKQRLNAWKKASTIWHKIYDSNGRFLYSQMTAVAVVAAVRVA